MLLSLKLGGIKMEIIMVVALILVLSTVAYGVYGLKCGVNNKKVKRFLGINVSAFFCLLIVAAIVLLNGDTVFASEVAADAANAAADPSGLKFIAAALSTGIASIGAGIAVAVTGSAAIGAISENDKLLGKTVIFVGLAEGIAIYGLIISIMILGS